MAATPSAAAPTTAATAATGATGNGVATAPLSFGTGNAAFAAAGATLSGGSSPGAAGASTATAPNTPVASGATPATPDALAASIVAMYRNGQPSLLLHLDPPGLGALSVHVAMGGNADVNLLFVPTVAQTAHLLHGGLGDLRQAMAASGLTLGQAQVGGGGTGGGDRGQTRTPARAATAAPFPEPPPQENAARGARAVA